MTRGVQTAQKNKKYARKNTKKASLHTPIYN